MPSAPRELNTAVAMLKDSVGARSDGVWCASVAMNIITSIGRQTTPGQLRKKSRPG